LKGFRIVMTRLDTTSVISEESENVKNVQISTNPSSETSNNEADAKKEDERERYLSRVSIEADRYATVHLSAILFPLLIGFAIKSLMMNKYSSWYSWFITTLTGCV
jgi:hypothetical protein